MSARSGVVLCLLAMLSMCMHVAIMILYIAFVVGMHSQQVQDEALYAEFVLAGLLP